MAQQHGRVAAAVQEQHGLLPVLDGIQVVLAGVADRPDDRGLDPGAPQQLADSGWIDAAVINAGDGKHAHPTQALLDAMTLRRVRSRATGVASTGMDLEGMHVVIVGDVLHSRVARSNVWLLTTLGARVTLSP